MPDDFQRGIDASSAIRLKPGDQNRPKSHDYLRRGTA
jgi:hypothetical protein